MDAGVPMDTGRAVGAGAGACGHREGLRERRGSTSRPSRRSSTTSRRAGRARGTVYALLEKALAKADRARVATFVRRGRDHLVALTADNGFVGRFGYSEGRNRVWAVTYPLLSQSLHAATTTGRDAAKKVPGRKRGLAVDVLGLVIAVVVLAASVHDNAFGTALLDKVAAGTSTVTKALVDQGFKKTVVDHGAGLGIAVPVGALTGSCAPLRAEGMNRNHRNLHEGRTRLAAARR